MRIIRPLICLLGAGLLVGCAPSPDLSGWEIARKRSSSESLEAFPDIPLVLPGSPRKPEATAAVTPMQGVWLKRLDEGSLFRRGYSAPTP